MPPDASNASDAQDLAAILTARRKAVARPLPQREQVRQKRQKRPSSPPSPTTADAFAFESHSFYIRPQPLPPSPPGTPSEEAEQASPSPAPAAPAQASQAAPPPTVPAASGASTQPATAAPPQPAQPPPPPVQTGRGRRIIAHWTPEMDRAIRRALAKHGWGCWTRIHASGKLPERYTPKMIANRAKALGLTRDMFGPAVSKP